MLEDQHWGAFPSDWDFWAYDLGLMEDLLPVVSNRNAVISPYSSMKSLGKTPSLYNSSGQVIGFKNWTQHKATKLDIEEWKKNPDYGICVQTRTVIAVDIDVDDEYIAGQVLAEIRTLCNCPIQIRRRSNSPRLLIPMGRGSAGPQGKKVLRLEEGGAVEILGDGQQFVACGTHTSGVRYNWIWAADAKHFPVANIKPC